MRILLTGKYVSLEKMLRLEGEEVVFTKEDHPDVVISLPPVVFPVQLYEAIDVVPYKTEIIGGPSKPDVVISRWFNKGWSSQTLIGFPLTTLMNRDLSCLCEAGMAMNFTNEEVYTNLFAHPVLKETLENMKFKGFVSFSLYISDKAEITVSEIRTGIPFNGFFNLLESLPGRLSQFLNGEDDILRESWTVNLLLSRYPYPHLQEDSQVYIEGISSELEKHLYLFECTRYKNTIHTETTQLGVATAWSQTLSESCRRVLRTLHNVQVQCKQFRTDLFRHTDNEILRLQSMGLF